MDENKYYIYVFLDPRKPGQYHYGDMNLSFNHEPFYIGKGSKYRTNNHFEFASLESNGNKNFVNKVKKLIRIYGKTFLKKYIFKINYFSNESDSFLNEIYFIDQIGRIHLDTGPLTNMTSGGEGSSGGVVSEETKKKQSDSQKKRWKDPKVREERSKKYTGEGNPFYGKKHKKETIEIIVSKNVGRIRSDEEKLMRSKMNKGVDNPMFGKSHSLEAREKIRNSRLGEKHKPETIAKFIEVRNGRPQPLKRKAIFINDIYYESMKFAGSELNIKPDTVSTRVRAISFSNYRYATPEEIEEYNAKEDIG